VIAEKVGIPNIGVRDIRCPCAGSRPAFEGAGAAAGDAQETPGATDGHMTRGVVREAHLFNHVSAEATFLLPDPTPIDDVPVPPAAPVLSAGQKAEAWLLTTLTPDALPSLQVIAEAKAAGIAPTALKRAKKALGVLAERQGRGAWFWRLPSEDHPDDGPVQRSPRRRAYHRNRRPAA